MGTELYGRVIEVVTGIQGQTGYRVKTTPVPDQSGFRVDFKVDFKSDGKPPKAQVTIYNPPKRMISDLLRGEAAFLSIEAGYIRRAGLIFAGIPIRDGVEVERGGNGEVKLEIVAHSGGSRYRTAATAIANGGRQVARSLATEIATSAGYTVGVNQIGTADVYPRGFSFSGKAVEALAQIAAYTRTELFMDGDSVSFLKIDPGVASEFAPVFSAKQEKPNLIGTPVWGEKGLKFQALLEPSLRPGKQVVVEFFDLTKDAWVRHRLVLREVTYSGSNFAQNFTISGVGRVVGG